MSVTITPPHTSRLLEQQLHDLRDEGLARMREAVRDTAQEMAQLAPGRLGGDIAEQVHASLGVITGDVFPRQDWAKYVEEGTGIYVEHHHPITPSAQRLATNPRSALKFRDGRIRRRSLGQRPQHFVRRTRERMEAPVADLLEQPAIDVTARLARS